MLHHYESIYEYYHKVFRLVKVDMDCSTGRKYLPVATTARAASRRYGGIGKHYQRSNRKILRGCDVASHF